MASKKKKKKSFSEQVISGTYESSLTKDKVGSALRSNSTSVAEAYKSIKQNKASQGVGLLGNSGYKTPTAGSYNGTIDAVSLFTQDDDDIAPVKKEKKWYEAILESPVQTIEDFIVNPLGGNKEDTSKKAVKLSPTAGQVNAEGYKDVGTTYGRYKYQNYAERKDYKIYEKEGKYYYYDEKRKTYTPIDQAEMTSKELDKKNYKEAKKLGYTGDKDTLSIEKQIQLDTAGLTEKEYKEYKKDLERQQKDEEEQQKRDNKVRVGGSGLKGSLGELEHLLGNAGETIDENVIEPIRDAKSNYELGSMTEKLGIEAYKKMMGEENNYDELKSEYEKYTQFNQDIVAEGNYLDQAFQTMPNQIGGLWSGIKGGGVGGTIGAIGGGIIGALTTKSVEGTVAGAKTGAKLLGGTGYVAGQSQYTYQLEAGLQYQALIDMGIPEEIAKKEAQDTGRFNALVESGESLIDLFTFGKLSQVKDVLFKDLAKEYGEETVKEWLVKSTLKNTVSEGLEETVQEGGSIYNEKQAFEQAGMERDDSQDLERLKESLISGMISSFVTSGGTNIAVGGTKVAINTINDESLKTSVTKQVENYEQQVGVKFTEDEKQLIVNETINGIKNGGTDIAPVGEIDTTEIDEIAPVVAQEVLNPTLVSGQDVRTVEQQDIAPVEAPVQDNRYVYTPQETDSQYKQAVSKSAEVVGLENNASTQTLIDLTAKVSERTGKPIEFTNNSQPEMIAQRNKMIQKFAKNKNISIEEATARLQGTTINGLTDGNRILINTDSNGYLNVILGHEITHTFETTGKLYTDLQDAVFKYASEKGEFELVSDVISATYEGQNANLNKELTSELVGRYLFTDQTFIDNLSAKKPNLFQRLYNEIKHLIKMATAGSNEARALEEVKYRFEKAMNKVASNETSKATVQETKDKSTTERLSNTQTEEYSLEVDNKGRELSEEQIEFFKDSVVRDEEGRLLTMYHGTRADFNVFESDRAGQNYEDNWSRAGRGHYFTPDIKYAKDYGEASVEKGPVKIKEVYLNITNPFDMSTDYSETLTDMKNEYNIDEFYLKAGYRLIDWFRDAKIDSTEVLKKYGFDGIHDFDDYIAFESNQIKDVENKNPTDNEDIRYSLSDNKGYHYGDLGKARDTNYFSMSNSRRSTGHFGNGTYFVGSKDSNVGSLKEGRQVHEVEFSDYNLFKPKNSMEAEQLHSLLKDINNEELNAFKLEDAGKLFNKSYEELYEAYKNTTAKAEEYKKLDDFTQLETDSLSTVFMKELGYNGIDVRGIEGFDNGTYGSVIYDLDNKISSEDIRYSLSSTGEMVDNKGNKVTLEASETGSTRNLMAIHNLNESKLFGVLEIGGLAYPSIAITDPSRISHEGYGRYTILLDKKSIDPKASTRNKVYSRDGYTPTFPQVDYETDKKAIKDLDKIKKTIEKATGSIQHEYWRDVHHFMYELDRYASHGLENIIDNAKNRRGLQYAYLIESGKDIELKTRPERYSNEFSNEELQTLLDNYKGNKDELTNISFDEAMSEENKQLIKETLINHYMQDKNIDRATAEDIASSEFNTSFRRAEPIFRSAGRYYKNGENQVFDQKATNEIIDQELNESDYENWLRDKFKDVVTGKKGLYNGSTWVTESGRERGFWQTHDEYNLANVVKLMRREKQTGNNWGFLPGSNVIFAGASKEFKSIKDIKANEDLLQDFSEELYQEKIQPLDERYTEVREQIVNAYMEKGYESNYFIASDYVNGQISESAVNWSKKNGNVDTVVNTLEDALIPVTREQAQELVDIFTESQKLPTSYFEAKPQRGVGFDEFEAVVIPNDATPEMKQALQDAGLTYYEYDPNIEGDRQRVINQFDDLKFSLSKEGEELAPVGDFNIKGSDVRLQKQVEEAIAPLKAEIETLTKTITDLQEDIAPASFESAEEQRAETQRTMTDEDAPLTDDGEFIFTEDVPLKGKGKDSITREIANDFGIKYTEARELYNKVANTENPTVEDVFDILSDYREVKMQMDLDEVNAIQHTIKGTRIDVSEFKKQITDYKNYRISNMGKGLILGNSGEKVDSVYQELNEMYGDNAFPLSVTAEVDQLDVISQWLYKEPYLEFTDTIDDDSLYDLAERILSDVGTTERYKTAEAYRTNWFRHYKDDIMAPGEEPRIKTEISQEDYLKSLPDALTDDYAPYLEVARDVNASNTEITPGNTSIADELSRLNINPFEEMIEAQNEEKQAPRVTKEKPGLKSAYGTVQELIFNDTYQIDKLAKETNRPSIKHNNYMLKGVYGEIPGDILVGQTDNYGNIIGLSVKDLWQPAHDSGLFEQFNDRMKHQLNIERWKTNKPLWYEIPADASKEIVKAYDETYPEFKEWADDIYNFYANSLDNKYEAGLVNDAQRKLLREELYPSYVRIDVSQLEKPYVDITPGEIRSKAPLKRAVGGSGSSAMSLEESMIKSVYADKMGIRQNKLYLEIAKALQDNRAEVGADVRQDLADMSEALYLDADTGKYYLTAYENGEQFTVEIGADLYNGLKNDLKQTLKNIEARLGKPLELVQKAGNLKRDLTTTYNPFFWLTNPPKDLFDGFINSKHVGGFAKNYLPAWKEAITNTGDAPQFRALYGSAMDMGDYASESGLGDTDGKLAKAIKNTKLLRGINKLNEITEIATRLAEFKASKEAGASLEEAMYNAREVTVNFDRGGTVTKFLDRNGFKFLNVSAQGFDKFIRNFSGQEGARATMGAWARALAFGIAPALVNHLLFGGGGPDEDEEYEALPDYIKDNYFLFKMDDGTFVRIPKGRMMAVFGSAGRRTLEFLGGEEDAYEGFLENSESQVGMANPFDNFLLAPIIQAYGSENGTTWYGEELIPSRLQDKAPEEQYDASTDKASIFLGELFGISPYKLNYVIDQYSGGIGDLVLPMITEETKTDGSLMAPFIDKFTANSTDDNKYASEIYALGDKRDKVPTAEKETDLYKIQDAYLYSITSEMGELYAEKREVQADSSLSKSEKYAKVQEIQDQINSLAKEGLDNYEYISQKENYAIVGGREFNKYTAEDGTERWGTPWEDELSDLNSMGMDLAEKNNYFTSKKSITEINDYYKDLIDSASEEEKDEIYAERKRDVIKVVQDTDLNDEMKAYLYNKYYSSDKTKVITTVGIDFDAYLDFESQQFEADKDSAGKSISGSKKAKVFAYINSMNLDFEERLILAKLQYNSYDTYNAEIINYLNSNSDISYDEEVEILKKLGFTVDANGRIYWE